MQIQIPGYSIVSTLSRGASATIYLAWDIKAERELALKVIALDAATNLSESLVQERERLLALRHPNIVTFYDVGIFAGHYFLAMQYLPGYNLNHKRFELDLLARLRVVADIAHALDFASGQGLVHAALTPDNIWVTDHNKHAVLLGIGLPPAAFGDARATLIAFTDESVTLPAAHFYSPEQLQKKPLDSRSDLYSLGVILFLLLTDKLPFQAASQTELQTMDRALVPLLPDYLTAFQPIINRLLGCSPEARYQHARECIADLGALPESAIVTAVEGAAHLLVRENESPLEVMARLIPFTAYNLFSSRMAEQIALVNSHNTIIVPDKQLRPLVESQDESDVELVTTQPIYFFDRRKMVSLAAILCVVTALIYVVVEKSVLPPSAISGVDPTLDQSLSVPATTIPGIVKDKQKALFESEPNLQQQADILRAQLPNDFSLATDLVIIYRAALRGDENQEHAFAQEGLEELQQLFSERILTHLNEEKLEVAARERDLAEQLFDAEELLPELANTFSLLEQEMTNKEND
jgi:serine/threonine protein kinase